MAGSGQYWASKAEKRAPVVAYNRAVAEIKAVAGRARGGPLRRLTVGEYAAEQEHVPAVVVRTPMRERLRRRLELDPDDPARMKWRGVWGDRVVDALIGQAANGHVQAAVAVIDQADGPQDRQAVNVNVLVKAYSGFDPEEV